MKTEHTPQPAETDKFRQTLRDWGHAFLAVRWAYVAIAFFLSATLWYMVTVRDKVETWVDVRVEFKGTPSGLVIRDGLITKVSARLRAAKGLSRSLNGRDAAVVLDLSSIKKGSTTLEIRPEMLPFTNAFEVMEITPSRVQIEADSMGSRQIAVQAFFEGSLPGDLFVKALHFTPQNVTVNGPETLIFDLNAIKLPVRLSGLGEAGLHPLRISVPMPDGLSAEPSQVAVDLDLGVRTKQVRLVRSVEVDVPEGKHAVVTPARVTIQVAIPESQAGKPDVLAGITALADAPKPGAGPANAKVPVRVLLPENAVLQDVTPKEVNITIKNE